MDFLPFCCKCWQPIARMEDCIVFSCGDFLCVRCFDPSIASQCVGCKKDHVRFLKMDSSVPEDVLKNFGCIADQFENLHNLISFQLKYYKQTLRLSCKSLDEYQRACCVGNEGKAFGEIRKNPSVSHAARISVPSPYRAYERNIADVSQFKDSKENWDSEVSSLTSQLTPPVWLSSSVSSLDHYQQRSSTNDRSIKLPGDYGSTPLISSLKSSSRLSNSPLSQSPTPNRIRSPYLPLMRTSNSRLTPVSSPDTLKPRNINDMNPMSPLSHRSGDSSNWKSTISRDKSWNKK